MIKLSNRMNFLSPEGAFAVLAQAQELERKGHQIIHLEIGQPDFDTPQNITNAGIEAIKSGKTRYTPSLGTHELRIAIADYISKSRRVKTSFKEVAVTPSAKTALFTALASIIDPGDEIIYPDPGFPAYKVLIEFFGGKAIPVPMIEERDFSYDMQIFKASISKKTKAVILNFPSNPTGTVISNEDLEQIANLLKKYGTIAVTDDIYSRMIYAPNKFKSIYSIPGMKEQTIIVDGFSKTYSMTGWRLGYLIAPEEIMERIDLFLTHSVACTASFTQSAGIAALNESQESVDTMMKEFQKRSEFIVDQLNSIKGVICRKPGGAFYAFPNIKSFNKTSREISDYLLHDAGVALLDGTSFGNYGEGYLRISYSTSMNNLKLGISKIKKSLEKL